MTKELLKRLEAVDLVDNSHGGGKTVRRNPDGPEAAALIRQLKAENERMRAVVDCATWVPLDDEGLAEVRVNGRRITSMPSYAGAEDVAERINKALLLTEPFRAAQSLNQTERGEAA